MPLFFIYCSLCYNCMLLILSICISYFLLYINIHVYIFYILVLNVKKHTVLNLEKINDYICNIYFLISQMFYLIKKLSSNSQWYYLFSNKNFYHFHRILCSERCAAFLWLLIKGESKTNAETCSGFLAQSLRGFVT